MKAMSVLLLWGMLSLTAFRCAEFNDERSPIDALEFELVVLDGSGNEKTVFEANTDVTLALRINNKSGKDFLWEYDYTCKLIQWSDLLLVYKKIENKGTDVQTVPVGRPNAFPTYCLMMNVPPQPLPPGISVIIGAQWSNIPANNPLGPGKYFTAVNHILDMHGHQKKVDLRVDFEMK